MAGISPPPSTWSPQGTAQTPDGTLICSVWVSPPPGATQSTNTHCMLQAVVELGLEW